MTRCKPCWWKAWPVWIKCTRIGFGGWKACPSCLHHETRLQMIFRKWNWTKSIQSSNQLRMLGFQPPRSEALCQLQLNPLRRSPKGHYFPVLQFPPFFIHPESDVYGRHVYITIIYNNQYIYDIVIWKYQESTSSLIFGAGACRSQPLLPPRLQHQVQQAARGENAGRPGRVSDVDQEGQGPSLPLS